jgi:hypothetical protein
VLDKVAICYEGGLREHVWMKGACRGLKRYALLRCDWPTVRPSSLSRARHAPRDVSLRGDLGALPKCTCGWPVVDRSEGSPRKIERNW